MYIEEELSGVDVHSAGKSSTGENCCTSEDFHVNMQCSTLIPTRVNGLKFDDT